MQTAGPDEPGAWLRAAERALNAKQYRQAHELCLKVLQRTPQCADALFLLGMIAAEHGNFGKAAEVIERALRLGPPRAEYGAQLGRCLLALNRPREALEVAMEALKLAGEHALTLDTIGVVLTRAGAHAEALQAFRRAVARDPSKAAYQYNLGSSLQFAGHFAAAVDAYRRALALDPNFYRAWSSLAQVSKQPFSEGEVAVLKAALDDPILDVDAELHLCHALAKHSEDCAEYSQAFRYLERGKRRKRATLEYSPAQDRQLFETVTSVCTAEFCRNVTPGYDSTEPIFIVGMPRTGTTLVERILSSHPEVFAAGELTHFALAMKRAASTPSNLVLDPDTLRSGAQLDFERIGHEYVESTRPRTGHTPRFIDKMPLNFFYSGFIHRALPRAKIICLRRNALDTCLSNYRQLFATRFSYYNYTYDLLDTGHYYRQFDALIAHWRTAIPANYCEVSYEAMVADTERETRRLLEFCELEWHPNCLQFHRNTAPVATASSVQVRQPIYDTSINRWRKYEAELAPLLSAGF